MIKLNGIAASYSDEILLIGLEIAPFPTRRSLETSIPLRAGAIYIGYSYEPRPIKATFALHGKSAERNAELAHALAVWASGDKAQQLIVDETPDRYYLAETESIDEIDYAEQFPELRIQFKCMNPFAYSLESREALPGDTFYYHGDVETEPVIQYVPAADVQGATWRLNDRQMEITEQQTIPSGHTILVDCANKIVTDNGDSTIMKHLSLYSDWLRIRPGANTFQGAEGSKLQYRECYL